MLLNVKLLLTATAALVFLTACASDIPSAPTEIAEPWQEPEPDVAAAAPEPVAAARQPRASTFAGGPKLREPFFSNKQLHRNFLSIAMRAEAADDVDLSGNIAVAKWVKPLHYQIVGGTSADIEKVSALVTRVRRLTGIEMAPADAREPNVTLSFVPFRFRDNAVYRLTDQGTLGPAVGGMVARWRDTEREKRLGLISVDPTSGEIAKADILIKDELPTLIRDACIVEEIVQSLGLMNDDPRARPSIFNDSQEFLDLTSHDGYLLRILYDPRVRPGMTLQVMRPLVEQIIREVRPEPKPSKVQA